MSVSINILDASGNTTSALEISEQLLNVPANKAVTRQALNQFLANQRLGTHATRNRAKVNGSQAKPWAQKGTGRARAGTRKSPIWRGGGVAFGPTPHKYTQRLNKKMKRGALLGALSDYQREGRLFVVEELDLAEPRTKLMVKQLTDLEAKGRILIMIDAGDKDSQGEYPTPVRNIFLAARNLPYVTMTVPHSLNIFELLCHDCLIMTKAALEKLEEVYG